MNKRTMKLEGKTYRSLIFVLATALMILPAITSFNELLTKLVEGIKIVAYIQSLVAPFIVRCLVVLIRGLGVTASGCGSYLYIACSWMPLKVYISWNCIGWQSLVLLLLTFSTGLQGPYSKKSKLLTTLIGLEGTFLVNLVRILLPILLAFYFGYLPAIIFHDYFGTILVLIWLGVFWYTAFDKLLFVENQLKNRTLSQIDKRSNSGVKTTSKSASKGKIQGD